MENPLDVQHQNNLQKNKQLMYAAYICYIASTFFGGVPAIVGVIIAYMKRGELQGSIYYDHCTFLIRTFWIGLIFGVLGALTLLIGIGGLILIAVSIWLLVRSVVGLIKLHDDSPINPTAWLI